MKKQLTSLIASFIFSYGLISKSAPPEPNNDIESRIINNSKNYPEFISVNNEGYIRKLAGVAGNIGRTLELSGWSGIGLYVEKQLPLTAVTSGYLLDLERPHGQESYFSMDGRFNFHFTGVADRNLPYIMLGDKIGISGFGVGLAYNLSRKNLNVDFNFDKANMRARLNPESFSVYTGVSYTLFNNPGVWGTISYQMIPSFVGRNQEQKGFLLFGTFL